MEIEAGDAVLMTAGEFPNLLASRRVEQGDLAGIRFNFSATTERQQLVVERDCGGGHACGLRFAAFAWQFLRQVELHFAGLQVPDEIGVRKGRVARRELARQADLPV